MVSESDLSTYSKSSEFVQQYVLENKLLGEQLLDHDMIFTSPMIIVLDILLRAHNQELPFDQLKAVTNLTTKDLRTAIDKCEKYDLIIFENSGLKLNSESDAVEELRQIHSQMQ